MGKKIDVIKKNKRTLFRSVEERILMVSYQMDLKVVTMKCTYDYNYFYFPQIVLGYIVVCVSVRRGISTLLFIPSVYSNLRAMNYISGIPSP